MRESLSQGQIPKTSWRSHEDVVVKQYKVTHTQLSWWLGLKEKYQVLDELEEIRDRRDRSKSSKRKIFLGGESGSTNTKKQNESWQVWTRQKDDAKKKCLGEVQN